MVINFVAQAREQRGVSRAHLARHVGVSRAYVTKLEQGKLEPSGGKMLRIAAYLKRPVEDVFRLAPANQFHSGPGPAAVPPSAPASVHPPGAVEQGFIVVSANGDGRGAPGRKPKPKLSP